MFEDADKFLKIAVGLGILAAGLGVGYHYGIYIPQHEREQIAAAKESREAAEESRIERAASAKAAYDICLGNASSEYITNWDGDCAVNGANKKTAGCTLNTGRAEKWNKNLKEANAICADIYKTQIR
ncbi:hypothetical protein [Sphingorhabdus sp.]|uniref:hypothetical protein n=1 Tax=Sphingorhabdus sp. TaxID=1902408 RepID=UPI0038FBE5A6